MNGRPIREALAGLVALAIATASGPTQAAHAVAPAKTGWWASPLAPSADVPKDGLYIEGTNRTTLAFAALLADVPDGAQVTLTMHLSRASASIPTSGVLACPLTTNDFTPSEGGAMNKGPTFDCVRGVPGTSSPDFTSFAFDLTSLVYQGRIGVALVPNGPLSRVIFNPPTDAALTVSVLTTQPLTGSGSQESARPLAAASPAAETPPTNPVPPLTAGAGPTTPTPVLATLKPDQLPATTTGPIAAPGVMRPISGGNDKWGPAIVLAILAAAGLLWLQSRRYAT